MDETRYSEIYARETESRIRHREFLLQGALSRRVHYLKREKGGMEEMCEYSERIFNGGKEEGLREGRREGREKGRWEMQDEILKMLDGISRQGSAEDAIKEIMNQIRQKETV